MDSTSLGVAGLAVIMPLLAALQPLQPVRALAAASVLLVLPGLIAARLLQIADPVVFLVVTVCVSLALTVLTSTALVYAGIWSWQLTLLLMGAITAAVATVTGLWVVPT